MQERRTQRPVPDRKIAIVTQGFGVCGGVSTVVEWLRAGLHAAGGYSVDVHDLATSSGDQFSRRLASPGTWTRRSLRGSYDEPRAAQSWGANCVEFEAMRYHQRSELTATLRRYDLIQVVAGAPALAAVATGIGVPTALQVATTLNWERTARRASDPIHYRLWRGAMTRWSSRIEANAIRNVDAVLVENLDMLEFALAAGQVNATKAPPGVDTTRFRPPVSGWDPNGYLLSVCRLGEPRKRLDRLIRAYEILVRDDASVPDLVLAGKGELSDECLRLISKLGLAAQVRVLRDVRPEGLCELYQGASVYLQTSQEEGLGISSLEAMACGLPVVSSDTAGAKESVLDGVSGWLVNLQPEETFPARFAERARVTRAFSGAAMAVAGRLRCEQGFSTEITLARFTDLYEQLLSQY